jgi:O-methyltransferase
MIQNIKDLIKDRLNKRGFRIILEENYLDTIRGIQQLYTHSFFKDFPVNDEERIKLISKLIGTGIHEAFYILYYLNKSLKIEGDICEFGCAQGATSALLAHEIRNTQKNIWLFDSFEGLPKPTEKDKLKDDIFSLGSIEKYQGMMSSPVTLVKKKLNEINFPLNRVKIIPGYIEKVISETNLPQKICFAYLDFDFYEPTSIALNSLDKHLSMGGFVVVDDYDYFSTGIKTAIDEFLKEKKDQYKMILPLENLKHFCILQKNKN